MLLPKNMAHLIDNSKGYNAFVSLNTLAWHGLGEVINGSISTQDALQKARLDFKVIKQPNIHAIPNADFTEFTEVISENSFFTYRTDCNKILGDKLGKNYEVLQNIDALNIVDEILQNGGCHIETAGSIDNGKKVFICLKMTNNILIGTTDFINQYLLIATSHDGSMSITAKITNVRVVCNNTLSAAMNAKGGKVFNIRHTTTAQSKIKEALQVVNLVSNNRAIMEDTYNKLSNTLIDDKMMLDYFGSLILDNVEIQRLRAGEQIKNVTSSQKQNNLSLLIKASKGIGQKETLKDGNITAWTAYNAYTSYLSSGKGYSSADDRANSMLFGSIADKNDKALVLADDIYNIEPLAKRITNLNLN